MSLKSYTENPGILSSLILKTKSPKLLWQLAQETWTVFNERHSATLLSHLAFICKLDYHRAVAEDLFAEDLENKTLNQILNPITDNFQKVTWPNLAIVLLSLDYLGLIDLDYIQQALERMKNDLKKGFPIANKDICDVLRVMKENRLYDPELLKLVAKKTAHDLKKNCISSSEAANCLGYFAYYGLPAPYFLRQANKFILKDFYNMYVIDLAIVLWSKAVLEDYENSATLFSKLFKQFSTCKTFVNDKLVTRMLYHAWLDLVLKNTLSPQQLEQGASFFKPFLEQPLDPDITTSHFHTKVSSCLLNLGLKHELEYPEQKYLIDCAIIEKKIAIECDGEHFHTFSDSATSRLGKDILRERTLTKLGWKIIHIPYEAWQSTPNWYQYLRDLLSPYFPELAAKAE